MFTKDQFGNIILDLNGKKKGEGQLQQAEVPPQSPLMAEQNGANPDAAKMAGTPAQTNAVRSEVTSNTLQEADKAQQRQAEQGAMTAQQQKQAAEAAQLRENYGEMGSRIQNIIDQGAYILGSPVAGQTPEQSQQPQQVKHTVNTEGLNESQTTLLNDYAANPTPQKRNELIKAGVADPESRLTQDVQGAVSSGLTTSINLTPDIVSQLGSSPAELAEVLGISEEELGSKTVQDLQSALQNVVQEEFTLVEQTVGALNNPALTPQERQLLKQELRQMGASGVYATEQEMGFLEDALSSADTVEFNGQLIKLEDLLSDDYMSQMITRFVEAPEGSKFRKELEENEPALASFIKQHEAAFKELSIHMDETVQEYDTIQQSRESASTDLKNIFGAEVGLADSVLEAMGLGKDAEFTQFDATQFPGMTWMLGGLRNGTLGKEVLPNLKELTRLNPTLASQVLKMSEQELKNLGIDKKGGGWNKFLSSVSTWDRVNKLDPKDANGISKELLGVSYSDLGKLLTEAKKFQAMGITPQYYDYLKQFIDPSGSFKLASPEQILKAMKEKMGNGQWMTDPTQFKTFMDLSSVTTAAKNAQKSELEDLRYDYLSLPLKIKQKLDKGTSIEPSDFPAELKTKPVSRETLTQMERLQKSPFLSAASKKYLKETLNYIYSEMDKWGDLYYSQEDIAKGIDTGIGSLGDIGAKAKEQTKARLGNI